MFGRRLKKVLTAAAIVVSLLKPMDMLSAQTHQQIKKIEIEQVDYSKVDEQELLRLCELLRKDIYDNIPIKKRDLSHLRDSVDALKQVNNSRIKEHAKHLDEMLLLAERNEETSDLDFLFYDKTKQDFTKKMLSAIYFRDHHYFKIHGDTLRAYHQTHNIGELHTLIGTFAKPLKWITVDTRYGIEYKASEELHIPIKTNMAHFSITLPKHFKIKGIEEIQFHGRLGKTKTVLYEKTHGNVKIHGADVKTELMLKGAKTLGMDITSMNEFDYILFFDGYIQLFGKKKGKTITITDLLDLYGGNPLKKMNEKEVEIYKKMIKKIQ